MAKFRVNIEWI